MNHYRYHRRSLIVLRAMAKAVSAVAAIPECVWPHRRRSKKVLPGHR